jgi:hypothetical protein
MHYVRWFTVGCWTPSVALCDQCKDLGLGERLESYIPIDSMHVLGNALDSCLSSRHCIALLGPYVGGYGEISAIDSLLILGLSRNLFVLWQHIFLLYFFIEQQCGCRGRHATRWATYPLWWSWRWLVTLCFYWLFCD